MACPSEKGAIIPAVNVGNPSRQVVFLVNSYSFRKPERGITPCHEDSLPEVPTPGKLNSSLPPTLEGLTDQTFITLMPTPQYSSLSASSNVQTDRICNTTTKPFYRNINGSGQLSSKVHGEEIKAVRATPDWGSETFKSAHQTVTGDPERTMAQGIHRAAVSHQQIDSRCTEDRYIRPNGKAKSASNCINYVAPSTLRQLGICSDLDQVPSSIATELTDSISRMEHHSQLANIMNNSTMKLATEIPEKPVYDKYHGTTNSPRKENINERNGHNGVIALTDCFINEDCHGSSSKRYILITTRIKNAATSRCVASVPQVESTPLTKRITIPFSEDEPKNEDTSTPALTSPPKLLDQPINESHTSDIKQPERQNPTYVKLSKDAGFPGCLPSPDKTFLSALLCEDNKPFEEWFATKIGDMGPFLEEYIIEGSNTETLLQTTEGKQNKESNTEHENGRKRKSKIKTDRSLVDNDNGSSLPDKPETAEILKFKLTDLEDETAIRSDGTMAKPSRSISSTILSSSTVFDDTKNVNERKVTEKVIQKGPACPVELADHQYSLSTSPLEKNFLTPVNSESDDDKSNLQRESSIFEDPGVERLAEGDVAHSGNGKRSSSSVGENLSRYGKDCSNFAFDTDSFGTPRSHCEGNVTSVNERRQSLRAGTLISSSPMSVTDTSVTMKQPDGILQAITKRAVDEVNLRLTPDRSSFVNNAVQQRKGSMLFAGDVNTNQNCSRDKENEIESSFSSKEVGSGNSPFDIQQQSMTVRDEHSSRKPFTRQNTDQYCMSRNITRNSKNETKMKTDDVIGYVDNKRKSATSTERINLGEKSQDLSSTSAISDIGTKGKDAFSQPKRKHDYNLRSCNRYKNQSSEITAQRSHKGLESSLNMKKVVHGVVQIKGDTYVQDREQGVGGKGYYNKSSSLENRVFTKVETVSDIPKERPAPSSRKTEREQNCVSRPASPQIKLTCSHESAVEIGTENDNDPHCLVENTCVRSKSDARIKVYPFGHSTVGYAGIVAKEQKPSPSYVTRHFIRNLGVLQESSAIQSTEQSKTTTKILTERGIKYTTARGSGQELAGCKRLSTRSQTSSRRFAKGAENEEKRFSSMRIEGSEDVSPRVRNQPSNRAPGLLKVKFPFIPSRRTRKITDHRESQSKRKNKEYREDVTTSRSTKPAAAPKPKMTMKLRLKPLRRGLQLKQSMNLLRRRKTKS